MDGVTTTAVVVWLVAVRATVMSWPTVAWPCAGATTVLAVRKLPGLTSTALVFTRGEATGNPESAAVPAASMTKTPPPAAVAV